VPAVVLFCPLFLCRKEVEFTKRRTGKEKNKSAKAATTHVFLYNGLITFVLSKRIVPMRCRNFFSAAVRQGSGAWPPFLDNNSWICLFLHPCCLVPSPPPPSFTSLLSVIPHSLCLFCVSFSMFLSHTEICAADCGGHGICVSGICRCDDGWMGTGCDQRACHPRCNEHGICRDGKCECSPGWNGEHCTIGRRGRGLGYWWGCLGGIWGVCWGQQRRSLSFSVGTKHWV